MRSDHFFDWNGFKYAVKLLVLLFVAGTLGNFGLLYAAESRQVPNAPPSLILIQETRPAPAKSFSLTLSTTTSEHIINALTIADAVPATGKFIAVDLANMILTLYQDGTAIEKYPILAKGKQGSPYETPSGFYTVLAKDGYNFNTADGISMPWSVQFYGNYSIHGWPYGKDGTPVGPSYSGGDIRLSVDDAEKVYDFAGEGAGIFVYAPTRAGATESLVLGTVSTPDVSAKSYMVADIDTGDVLLEQEAGNARPMTSAAKLMAALVANEMLPFDIKNSSSQTYNIPGFIDWMNAKAKVLGMQSTRFADASSTSTENVSTADDLFRLAAYLANKKTFVLDTVKIKNPIVSVISVPINGALRRVAIIVLKSNDPTADITALTDWFTKSAGEGAAVDATACASCASPTEYRKIQL